MDGDAVEVRGASPFGASHDDMRALTLGGE